MSILKNISKSYDNRFDPKMARMMTDFLWYGSVRLGSVLLILAFVLGAWLFYVAQGIVQSAKATAVPVETVSREQLSAVLNTFATRAVQYNAAKATTPVVVDPGK